MSKMCTTFPINVNKYYLYEIENLSDCVLIYISKHSLLTNIVGVSSSYTGKRTLKIT